MNIIVNTVAAMETGIMLNINLHVTFPNIPGIQETSPWMKFTWTGIIVQVNIKSAMAMLAMNKFMALVEWDLFKTTNNPIELPSKAMVNITAYAHVIPILNRAVVAAEGNENCLNIKSCCY